MGTAAPATEGSHDRIYAVVARIPRGRVATYGQVAVLAGMRGHARLVGYALSALRGSSRVPWHRVINAQGLVCVRSRDEPAHVLQRLRLEREGVRFDDRERVSFDRFRWRPRGPVEAKR